MNFAELVAETMVWNKAPHMGAAVRSAIRAVTLKYHRKELFWRDLVTVNVAGLPYDTVQLLDIASLLPRFRKLAAVEGCTIVNFGDMTDSDGYAKVNIAMMAGTNLNIKRRAASSTVAISYYQDPIVSPEELYSSWIAETQPDLIICGAAARTLAWNAESEIYKAALQEEASQWIELVQNNIEGVAR